MNYLFFNVFEHARIAAALPDPVPHGFRHYFFMRACGVCRSVRRSRRTGKQGDRAGTRGTTQNEQDADCREGLEGGAASCRDVEIPVWTWKKWLE